jgi:hypothetical protein
VNFCVSNYIVLRYITLRSRVTAMTPRQTNPDPTPPAKTERYLQLSLFDASEYAGRAVEDPLAGWALRDVLALAVDVEPELRMLAASVRWNGDARLQRLLASDPEERVVLALLDRVDPGVEAAEIILAGPHVAARRELARRPLRTDLLERLANDADPVASAAARRTLARRIRSRVRADLHAHRESA